MEVFREYKYYWLGLFILAVGSGMVIEDESHKQRNKQVLSVQVTKSPTPTDIPEDPNYIDFTPAPTNTKKNINSVATNTPVPINNEQRSTYVEPEYVPWTPYPTYEYKQVPTSTPYPTYQPIATAAPDKSLLLSRCIGEVNSYFQDKLNYARANNLQGSSGYDNLHGAWDSKKNECHQRYSY